MRGEVCLSITSCQLCSWRGACCHGALDKTRFSRISFFSPDLFSTLHCTTPRLQPSCIAVLPAPQGQHRASAPRPTANSDSTHPDVEEPRLKLRAKLRPTRAISKLETGNSPLSVKVSPARCDGKRYSVRYGPPSTDSSRGTYAVASPRAWQHQAHIPIPVVLSGPRL